MAQSLAGRAALVTGSAGGFGRLITRGLLESGASVVVAADVDTAGLEALRVALAEEGLDEIEPAVWDNFVSVNFSGAWYLTKMAYPHMKAKGWGRILPAHRFGREANQRIERDRPWDGSTTKWYSQLAVARMWLSHTKQRRRSWEN
jgi:NAD(P)-dependent dehydrogenase (short-subunit alcohol dehydrogenase family)